MAITQRGQIRFRDRARQIKDFSGLLFGNITPTDIDGLIEYHGKAYIVIELKLAGSKVPDEQRLALERLVDDLTRAYRPALCIIAEHNYTNIKDSIDVANCLASEYRLKGQWHRPLKKWKVKHMITKFLESLREEKI